MAEQTDLTVRIDAITRDFEAGAGRVERELDKVRRAAQRTELDMARLQKQMDDEETAQWENRAAAMENTGRAMIGFGTAAAIGFGYATKAAMDWESAWAGVTKTVDGSTGQLSRLQGELRQIATTMPASHQEIAAVAEAAGALGVKTPQIAAFTRTMIQLGTTTDLTSEDAANGLARLANVMGTSQKDVDRLGSSLVALGNDGASTESEILAMAQRIAGAGKQLNLTEPEVLAMASALSSVGIKAEAGGSSMSNLLVKIQEAVSEGGSSLASFARVAGVSAEQFKRQFGEDAAGAFDLFVRGLGRIKANGGDTLAVLKQLGITEIRQRDAVLRLAGAGDLLSKSLNTGNKAWKDNVALIREAEKRYDTTESKAKIAFNTFKDGAIDIGNVLLPALANVVTTVRDLLKGFNSLPGPVKTAATILGTAATAVALVGGAALIAIPKIASFKATVEGLSAGPLKSTATGLSRVASFMTGPLGAAIGIGITAFGMYAANQGATAAKIEEVTATLDEQTGAITENTRRWAASKIADELEDVTDAAETAGISLEQLAKAAIGNPDALDEIIEKRERLYELSIPDRSQAQPFGNLTSAQIEQLKALIRVIEVVEDSSGVIDEAQSGLRTENAVLDAFGKKADKAADKQKGANEAWGEGADAADALGVEVESLADQFETLTGATLDEREAKRQWFSALRDVNDALKENGRTLDEHTEKGAANQEKVDALVKASQDWLATQDEIGTSAKGVKRGFDRQHEAIVQALIDFGKTRKQAEKTADKLHKLPSDWKVRIRQEGADKTRDAIDGVQNRIDKVDRQLDIYTSAPGSDKTQDELEETDKAERGIADKHEISLSAPRADKVWDQLHDVDDAERGIADKHEVDTSAPGAKQTRDQLQGVDKDIRNIDGKKVNITLAAKAQDVIDQVTDLFENLFADGSLVDFNADGDVKDGHLAQIVPAGSWRVFGEDETGGEAYIPFAESKRGRSRAIADETVRRLGGDVLWNADGNITLDTRANLRGNPRRDVRRIDGMFGDIAGVLSKGVSKALSDRIASMSMGFHWPLPPRYDYSGTWGSYPSGGSHPALDFPAPRGTPIYSVLPGRVTDVQHLSTSFGNNVRINHGRGMSSISAHMLRTAAAPGDVVSAGETIGYVDSTGSSTGDHLHLTMLRNGSPFNYTRMLNSGGSAMPVGVYDGDHSGLDRASPARARAYARSIMGNWGWGPGQWPFWEDLGYRESGWRYDATNPTSGAYGIPQSLPPSKMASAGADWRTNVGTQLDWMAGYMHDRYGSPAGAIRHHNAVNWYGDGSVVDLMDSGGILKHGRMAVNLSGQDEGFLNPESTRLVRGLVSALHSVSSGGSGKNRIDGFGGSTSGFARTVPGSIRSVREMLELISKPAVERNIDDLNDAWRRMRRETRELSREERQLSRMRDRSRASTKAVRQTEKRLEDVRNDREKADRRAERLEGRLASARQAAGDETDAIRKAERDLGKLRKQAAKNDKVSVKEREEIVRAEERLNRMRRKAGGASAKITKIEEKLAVARDDEATSGEKIHRIRERLRNQRERAKVTGKELEKQERDVERQRNKLANATERWKNMQRDLIEQAQAVADAITAAGEVFGGAGTSVTAQGLLGKLTGAREDAGTYGRLLKRVKDRGVDSDIIDQILEQGQTPESLALLRSLSTAPQSLIRQINRQQDRLDKIANRVGTWTITPQRHQGRGGGQGGNNGPDRPPGRPVNVNINGPISTTDIKGLGRELENRWRRGLLVAQGA